MAPAPGGPVGGPQASGAEAGRFGSACGVQVTTQGMRRRPGTRSILSGADGRNLAADAPCRGGAPRA